MPGFAVLNDDFAYSTPIPSHPATDRRSQKRPRSRSPQRRSRPSPDEKSKKKTTKEKEKGASRLLLLDEGVPIVITYLHASSAN
jgi:hypothetical protein